MITELVNPSLRRHKLALTGAIILSFLGLGAVFADFLASDLPIFLRFHGQVYVLPCLFHPVSLQSYDNQKLRSEFGQDDWAIMPLIEYGPQQQPEILRPPPASPDAHHWLGTDDRGRDVLARLIHGTRMALLIGFGTVLLSVPLGAILGLLAGYYGRWTDRIISRLLEISLTFPTLFLLLIIMALQDKPSIVSLILVLGLTRWPSTARLMRAEVLRLKELDFISAARVCGAGTSRILFYHLIPNALGPLLVNVVFGFSSAILLESALSFLGFGTPPPLASWGEILSQANEHQNQWWLSLGPGALLFLTLLSLNALGEGLRDMLDPRLREY